jgi:hypothetical protein
MALAMVSQVRDDRGPAIGGKARLAFNNPVYGKSNSSEMATHSDVKRVPGRNRCG